MAGAKFHYHLRQNFHIAQTPSLPGSPVNNANFTATRATTDTLVRSLWSPRLVTTIDPSVNPPAEDWWVDATVILSVRFEKGGVAGPGSSPYLASTIGTINLYPTFVRDSPANALEMVVFAPLESPSVIETGRKGDGVHTPFVNYSFWATDFHAVFLNPGAGYSVKHSINNAGTTIWASDLSTP